jgi:hypothetical protein
MNGEDQGLTFRAYVPQPRQRATLEINGQAGPSLELAPGWQVYDVSLPASGVRPGLNEIWLRFEATLPTASVHLSPRIIGRTGIESPVNLVVSSAGKEVGDFGLVYVDGKQVSPNRRGYNVVVLDSKSGAVEQTACFDTHLDPEAGLALAAFLNGVPSGHIVAVAVGDEASRLLGQEAVDALRGIGVTGDLRGRFRWGQAIIGVRGAVPGTALEAMDWMRPVHLAVGDGATEPDLAAAFSRITFAAR